MPADFIRAGAWAMRYAMTESQQDAAGSGRWRAGRFDRLASFRFTYVALLLFVVLYVFSVKGLESMLEEHFAARLSAAVGPGAAAGEPREPRPEGADEGSASGRLGTRLDGAIANSRWVRPGGVRVAAMVFGGSDNRPLYIRGKRVRYAVPVPDLGPNRRAIGEVLVAVPHNSLVANGILIAYAAVLVQALFWFARRRARMEEQQLRDAVADRERAAARAAEIETRLAALTEREAELRSETGELTRSLEGDRDALEELLDEALADLGSKEQAIRDLEDKLARAARGGGPRRQVHAAALRRRFETLYPNVQLDERAARDLAELEEEPRLRAEQAVKRLSEDSASPAVRRKLGGLPGGRSIFELGFSGKRRIYFAKCGDRGYRVLRIGAKNSQPADLEYLSRVTLEG